MRDYQLLIWRWARGGKNRRKLSEAKGCEDSGNIGIVGEVEIKGLIEWEGDGVVIEGDVILCSG